MNILYRHRRFGQRALRTIGLANEIISEYQDQGFSLTLRQLYYQFVARGLIPNSQREYKNLGSVVDDARMAGLIDWLAIEDRTRNLRTLPCWKSPKDIMSAVVGQYRTDPWLLQSSHVEVWIEKDALVGVIERVCNKWRVPFFACRGYNSQSEQWAAGRRMLDASVAGYEPIVLHLGDHDPSGIDMTRDNEERLSLFAEGPVEVRRLALNINQVRKHNPPPNPAKETDSRCSSYVSRFGNSSWELDALDPRIIESLIDSEIQSIISPSKWKEAMANEESGRDALIAAMEDME